MCGQCKDELKKLNSRTDKPVLVVIAVAMGIKVEFSDSVEDLHNKLNMAINGYCSTNVLNIVPRVTLREKVYEAERQNKVLDVSNMDPNTYSGTVIIDTPGPTSGKVKYNKRVGVVSNSEDKFMRFARYVF